MLRFVHGQFDPTMKVTVGKFQFVEHSLPTLRRSDKIDSSDRRSKTRAEPMTDQIAYSKAFYSSDFEPLKKVSRLIEEAGHQYYMGRMTPLCLGPWLHGDSTDMEFLLFFFKTFPSAYTISL